MNPDPLAIVNRFERRYRGAAGPPWTDGSITSALLAIRDVQSLVFNGGWPSVYYNNAGWAVPIAIPGYVAIRAHQHAAIATEAAQSVARAEAAEPDAVDDSERWLSDRLMELAGDAMESLDDRWIAAEKREDIITMMAQFIIDNNLLDERD